MERQFKPLKRVSIEEASKYVSADEDFTNSFICYYTIEKSDDPYYPSSEGWDMVTYYTARSKKPIPGVGEGKEIIYIMSNPSIPGLLKIGYTGRPVEKRENELSKHAGVASRFKTEYIFRLHGRGEELEREIHRYLEHKRHSSRREFFDISINEAIEAINRIGEKYI